MGVGRKEEAPRRLVDDRSDTIGAALTALSLRAPRKMSVKLTTFLSTKISISTLSLSSTRLVSLSLLQLSSDFFSFLFSLS